MSNERGAQPGSLSHCSLLIEGNAMRTSFTLLSVAARPRRYIACAACLRLRYALRTPGT